MAMILTILGVLLVLEGIPYAAFPVRVKEWAAMMQGVPVRSLRIIGLVSMITGLFVLFVMRVGSWLG
ncbi:MAG: DUF2065 domain-containing protein [Deltaproteobacteria bacterium]|nr:DUF2065 domain-containing protein [Deltaproteobacteria bacterium]